MRRLLILVAATAGLGIALHLAPAQSATWANAALLIAALAATGALLWRTWHGPDRVVWGFMAAGGAAFSAAEAYWFLFEVLLGGEIPTVSLADPFYFAGYGFLMAGLLVSLPRFSLPERLRVSLDAIVLGSASMALAWILVLRDLAAASPGDALMVTAYPALDLALATMAVVVASGTVLGRRLLVIGLGLLMWVAVDFAYAAQAASVGYASGMPLEALWLGGYLAFGLAALGANDPPMRTPRWLDHIVYVPVLVLLPAGIIDFAASGMDPVVFAIGVIMVTALVGRQFLYSNQVLKSHRALERSRTQLVVAQGVARLGSWEFDVDTGVLEWSAEARRIYGLQRGSVRPSFAAFFHLVHPDDRQNLERRYLESVQAMTDFTAEHRILVDGEVRHVRQHGTTTKRSGHLISIGIVQDITEQKELEQEREAIQTRYRDLVENSPSGILRTTQEGWLEYANNAAAEMLGYKSAKHLMDLHRQVTEIYTDATDRQRLLDELAHDRPDPIQLRLKHFDGTAVWVEVRARMQRGDHGNQYVEETFRDLTAERTHHELAHQMAAIVEASEEAMYSMDLDGVVRTWNPAAEKLFGYNARAVIGRRASQLLVPAKRSAEFEHLLERSRRGVGTPRRDDVGIHKDGSHLDISTTLVPIRDASNAVTGISATTFDIRDRKAAEQAEKAHLENEHLKQLDQTLRDFINSAGHDLSGPMLPIRLQVEILQNSPDPLSDRQRHSLAIVDRNVHRMALMVQDLLDVARLESGRLELVTKAVAAAGLLHDLRTSMEGSCRQKQVELRVPETDLHLEADDRRIVQVLFNLVNNALKFTPAGGRIDVRVQTTGRMARIEVQDTGAGLRPDMARELFRPFSRMHLHLAVPGTGLGLYISKQIVEQHGGKMGAKSPGEGMGSTFWFTVPLANAVPIQRTIT